MSLNIGRDIFRDVYVHSTFDETVPRSAVVQVGDGQSGPVKVARSPAQVNGAITWNNLNLSVTQKGWPLIGGCLGPKATEKQILKPQNGELVSGTLTAIMGPSGAGKTTLLNCLAGHIVSNVKGDIMVTKASHRKWLNIAYVPQHDNLFEVFTPREYMMFSSKLKNLESNYDHEAQVDKILNWLNLVECQDTYLSECSGGQRKRVSIGVELVSGPDVLILDEPTTGLDSSTAIQCIEMLRRLTESVANLPAIVATIHQPNFKIVQQFHKLYLLSRDGQNIYFGSPMNIVEHFEKFGLSCPKTSNPVDYAIEVAYGDEGEEVFEPLAEACRDIRYEGDKNGVTGPLAKMVKKSDSVKLPFWRHLMLLLWRDWNNKYRSSQQFWFVLIQAVAVGITLSCAWTYEIGKDDACWDIAEDNVKNVSSKYPLTFDLAEARQAYTTKVSRIADNGTYLYSLCMHIFGAALNTGTLIFPYEVKTIKTEVGNKWYKVGPYMVAKILTEIPTAVMSNFIMLGISYYFTAQIPELWRFFSIVGIYFLMEKVVGSLGLLIGAIWHDDPRSASPTAVAVTMPVLLLGGFFVRHHQMPVLYQYLASFSYLRYAFESVLILTYGFGRCGVIEGPRKNFVKDIIDASTPQALINKVFNSLDWSLSQSTRVGVLIGADAQCVDGLFNSTRQYFSETSDTEVVVEGTHAHLNDNPSYILSYYGLYDELLYRNVATLCLMAVMLYFFIYLTLVRVTRARK
ncbi:ATP-binding cassette sub-family G member 1 [Halotydeus destructor]|nr:ATP-binding cassette sub-family G member 1 [Halotydeus destructor]